MDDAPDRRRLDGVPETPGDSYWLWPDRLLAGPYPGALSSAQAREKIEAFLDVGVTCFVDLTEEGEGSPPLAPYAGLLRERAQEGGVEVTHIRLPIRDVDIPTEPEMRCILATVRRALDEGDVVYVHCWGGVGRTGTVVGCLLVEDGIPATEALDRLRELRARTERAGRPSPETTEQRDFVLRWRT